jgi:hypothetical protein
MHLGQVETPGGRGPQAAVQETVSTAARGSRTPGRGFPGRGAAPPTYRATNLPCHQPAAHQPAAPPTYRATSLPRTSLPRHQPITTSSPRAPRRQPVTARRPDPDLNRRPCGPAPPSKSNCCGPVSLRAQVNPIPAGTRRVRVRVAFFTRGHIRGRVKAGGAGMLAGG